MALFSFRNTNSENVFQPPLVNQRLRKTPWPCLLQCKSLKQRLEGKVGTGCLCPRGSGSWRDHKPGLRTVRDQQVLRGLRLGPATRRQTAGTLAMGHCDGQRPCGRLNRVEGGVTSDSFGDGNPQTGADAEVEATLRRRQGRGPSLRLDTGNSSLDLLNSTRLSHPGQHPLESHSYLFRNQRCRIPTNTRSRHQSGGAPAGGARSGILPWGLLPLPALGAQRREDQLCDNCSLPGRSKACRPSLSGRHHSTSSSTSDGKESQKAVIS